MSKKIATLWDKSEPDKPDEQPQQAFYAGGSEHSGQQILGPSRDRLIENLFTQVQQAATQGDDREGATSIPITFYRNGFTVDDGELRSYEAPNNRQFLEFVKRGETPPELARIRGNIDVKLVNKAQQDHSELDRKFKAFSGEGHRLG